MPSTRRNVAELMDPRDLPDDSDSDPDYREDSADEDDLPPSMGRDRAQWVVDNTDAIEELYKVFKEGGNQLFGRAFFQCGGITAFSHFLYRYTQPGAA